ncbi:MFS transporter [Pseudonocardia xishanensis]|uniref:MFS transporter n=1 Tax=Pseudonocardia xishanensis TaxID=630995 RepID=UPI0031F19EF4
MSSYLGNTIEYYDFILYGSAAAVVFGPLFFSNLSPALGTIASFATLATGYIARPLGGLVLGHVGDRVGRKRVLLLTIVMMGLASGLIGLLPTYAQIGAAAPLLLILLRLVQGFAVGGEWGGAALLAAEHAPPARRGLITAIGQAGLPSGGLLSTLALGTVSLLPGDQLMAWGWRVPFLFSFLLLAVGLYMRVRVSESPLFTELDTRLQEKNTPLVDVLRNPGPLLRGIAASLPPTVVSTLFGSFAVSYTVGLGASRSTVLAALSVGWAGAIVMTPIYGLLSDRFGRRPVYVSGALAFAVLAYPLFWAIGSGSTALMYIGFFVVFALVAVCMSAALAALLSEMFSTRMRYTGISAAYQVATIVAGFSPLVAGSLLAAAGGGRNIGWVAGLIVVLSLLAAVAVWFGRESSGSDLRGIATPAERATALGTDGAAQTSAS